MELNPQANEVLQLAEKEAERLGHTKVCAEHLLLSLLRQRYGLAIKIVRESIDPDALANKIEDVITHPVRVKDGDEAWIGGRFYGRVIRNEDGLHVIVDEAGHILRREESSNS